MVHIWSSVPNSLELTCIYPNPFNGAATIVFKNIREEKVRVTLSNLRGELLQTLWDQQLSSGRHVLNWDGRSGSGHQLASGVYVCTIQSSNRQQAQKLILHK